LIAALDEAWLSRFICVQRWRRGSGSSDACDLFVTEIASTLITKDWNLNSGRLALFNSTMLAAACLGAFVFGPFADVIGRKRAY
jgi:MFS family permease